MFEKLIRNVFKYNCEWKFLNSKILLKGFLIDKDKFDYKSNNIFKLTIKSKKKIPPGWYLFVIRYSSNDVNLDLKISSYDKDLFFSHQKKISPERKKFRIIRFSKESLINVTFDQLS